MANPVALKEEDIQQLVQSSLEKNNAALLACMKSAIEESVNSLKRANSEASDCQIRVIKKLKFDEPRRFKKKANEDQFKFNLKSSLEQHKFENVKTSLEQGEVLLKERQKHILLADKSPSGWATVAEYKRNELAENSDDEKKMYKAEARAKAQLKQAKQKSSSMNPRSNSRRPRHLITSEPSSSIQGQKPIPTIGAQYRATNIKPGNCFQCGKQGHWRAQCPMRTTCVTK